MQVKRILVPTDLSEFGALALRYAEELSAVFGAHVTVMHAMEPPFAAIAAELPLADLRTSEELKKEAEQKLRAFVIAHSREAAATEVLVAEGYPATAILETAREIEASLIVLGTHGRRGWRRALLGSVAERVLRESTIPVLTVAPLAQASKEPRLKLILCPVNFSLIGHKALEEASALAAATGAELIVLHVSEAKSAPPIEKVQQELDAWVAPAMRSHCRYSQIITHGNAAQRVLDIADEMRADLLVIGAQHRLFADGTVIGTTSERVVRFARTPVLTIVRAGAEAEHAPPEAAPAAR